MSDPEEPQRVFRYSSIMDLGAKARHHRCRLCLAEVPGTEINPDGLCPVCVGKRKLETRRQDDYEAMMGEHAIQHFTFPKFRICEGNRETYNVAVRFDPTKDNLYLYGQTRQGKTHLAKALAHRCFETGHQVLILSPQELMRRLIRARRESVTAEENEFMLLAHAEVLLIDDLNTDVSGRGNLLYDFYIIVNERLAHGRAGLIVTSILSLEALSEKFGDDRLSSRIAAMGYVRELKGASATAQTVYEG